MSAIKYLLNKILFSILKMLWRNGYCKQCYDVMGTVNSPVIN